MVSKERMGGIRKELCLFLSVVVFIAVIGLSFLSFVTACNHQIGSPTLTPVQMGGKTFTAVFSTLTMMTQSPTLHTIPPSTRTPIVSATKTVEVSWTPLPTLNKDLASQKVQELLENNGGCSLPCWWGIDPGKTTWQQAQQALRPFVLQIRLDSEGYPIWGGKQYHVMIYWIEIEMPDLSVGKFKIIVRDGIVEGVKFGRDIVKDQYKLGNLLRMYGKPDQIYVRTLPHAFDGGVPFHLVLYYSAQRFFANYYFDAALVEEQVQACPANVSPAIRTWDFFSPMEENLLEREVLGIDPNNGLQKLMDATGIDVNQFYNLFIQQGSVACFESPVDFWDKIQR